MTIASMNPAIPGNIASSADYNIVLANIVDIDARVVNYKEARSSGDETVTTTATDVNGITAASFSTHQANTPVKFTAVFDVGVTGGSDTFIGTLVVDGTPITTGEAHFEGAGSERATITQVWVVTLTGSGSHTAKLQRAKSGTSDTVTLFGTHTKLVIEGSGVS
jgi:hypothetical protein